MKHNYEKQGILYKKINHMESIIYMKKENIYKFLYVVSIFLVIGFAIRVGVDYFKYDSYNNFAPFYVFIVAKITKKKYNK